LRHQQQELLKANVVKVRKLIEEALARLRFDNAIEVVVVDHANFAG